jgi:hypothetical protein
MGDAVSCAGLAREWGALALALTTPLTASATEAQGSRQLRNALGHSTSPARR